MHTKNILFAGKPLNEAKKAIIMLHGRGAEAEDILSVSKYLNLNGFSILAPRAKNNTWYPYSFLFPDSKNEPWLTSAIDLLSDIVNDLRKVDINENQICFLGFSQGACLALEFTARNAKKYGGVIAFSGGLTGDSVIKEKYSGDFEKTPVFIGSGDHDSHIPIERVKETSGIFKQQNADITLMIYENMGHTITLNEIDRVNSIFFDRISV